MSRRHRVADGMLVVLGCAGLLTAAWALVAWALSLSVVVLATGSMSPGMPSGTAILARQTPADEVIPGDVVTVHRAGDGRRVTHRVVSVTPAVGLPGHRVLTLRGDANAAVDRDVYVVDGVDRAVVAVPEVGRLLLWARQPGPVLAVALTAAAAVCWGLWPRAAPAGAQGTRGLDRPGAPK